MNATLAEGSAEATPEHAVVGLETAALRRWLDDDPGGFLDISADDVVYFDPFIPRRLDGLGALRAYYEGLRGQIRASHFELRQPLVQDLGQVAVLTFNFASWNEGNPPMLWNCTEVYRRTGGTAPPDWKIIQTHWSLTAH